MLNKFTLCVLLSTALIGCGSDDGNSSNSTKPKQEPVASNVNIVGSAKVGESVSGSYEFIASQRNETDASELFWQKTDGTQIGQSRSLHLDDDALQGHEIQFCVRPVSSGNRVKGNIVCSSPMYVEGRDPVYTYNITLTDLGYGYRVGHRLTALSDGGYEDIPYQWYADDRLIQGESKWQLRLTSVHEGASIHACTTYRTKNKTPFCSKKTTPILGALGSAPVVDIKIAGDQQGKIKVGGRLTSEITYHDRDGDKEDVSKRQYRWYTTKGEVVGATSPSLIISPEMLNQHIKGCVTVYAKTGDPKASDQTCSPEFKVLEKAPVAPVVSKLTIDGIAMVGYRLKGSYEYFDGNDDVEGKSLLEWKTKINSTDILAEGEVLRLDSTMQEEAKNMSSERPVVYFCVTPQDINGTQGKTVCKEQRLSQIFFEGSLTPAGEVRVSEIEYPNFSQSWWKFKGNPVTGRDAWSFDDNKPKVWIVGSSRDYLFIRYRPIMFCIEAKDVDGDAQEICTEVTMANSKVSGARLTEKAIGFEPLKEYELKVEGNPYRLYRPIFASEFAQIANSEDNRGKFASAEVVMYDTDLGKEEDEAKGIKLIPSEALSFCYSTSGGIVSNKVLNTAQSHGDVFRAWSNFEAGEWLVINDEGKLAVFDTWDINPDATDESNMLKLRKAIPTKKYRFICSHDLS